MHEWMSVGQILKEYRKMNDISRNSVAFALNLNPKSIEFMENVYYSKPLDPNFMEKWLDALSIREKEWFLYHNQRWPHYCYLSNHIDKEQAKVLANLIAILSSETTKPLHTRLMETFRTMIVQSSSIIPEEPPFIAEIEEAVERENGSFRMNVWRGGRG